MTDPDAPRPHEVAVPLPASGDAWLRVIGRLRTPWTRRADCPRQGSEDGPDCRIEILPHWHAALDGIEAYARLEVLYWLDRARRDLAVQNPKGDGVTYGTFALRSPVRPNPIGTAIVRLIARDGGTLTVRGLDCLDGTPLIDLKPERGLFTPKAAAKPADGERRR